MALRAVRPIWRRLGNMAVLNGAPADACQPTSRERPSKPSATEPGSGTALMVNTGGFEAAFPGVEEVADVAVGSKKAQAQQVPAHNVGDDTGRESERVRVRTARTAAEGKCTESLITAAEKRRQAVPRDAIRGG